MEINMKPYNLEAFSERDLYTWDDIIDVLEEQECIIKKQEKLIEELKEYREQYCELYDKYCLPTSIQ